jgi:hypothetical protein
MAPSVDVLVICAAIPREEALARFLVRRLRQYRTPRRLLLAQPDLRPRLTVALATIGEDTTPAKPPETCRYLVPVLSTASGPRPAVGACIECFLQTQPVNQVLPVALEPDLEACMPEALLARVLLADSGEAGAPRRIDLLIVDCSAAGPSGWRRCLRREQLRLLAPLIGTHLAVLTERERERRLRRLRRAALTAGILAAAFTAVVALSTLRVPWTIEPIADLRREQPALANRGAFLSALPGGRILTAGTDSATVWSAAGQRLYTGRWSAVVPLNAGGYLLAGNTKDPEEYALDLQTYEARPTGYRRAGPAAPLEGSSVGPDQQFLTLVGIGGQPFVRLVSLGHRHHVTLLKLPLTAAQYTVVNGYLALTDMPNWAVVSSAILTAGGRLLLVLPRTRSDRVWTLWDSRHGKLLKVLASPERALGGAGGMALDETDALIATTEEDAVAPRQLCLWDLADGRCRLCKPFPNFSALSSPGPEFRFADHGSRLIVPSGPNGAFVYALRNHGLELEPEKPWRRYLAGSPGTWVAGPAPLLMLAAAATGTEIWDVAHTSRHLTLPDFRFDDLSSLSITPDHRFLFAQRAAGSEIWDLSGRRRVASLPAVGPGFRVAFTVDSTGLILFGQSLLSLWDVTSGRQVAQDLEVPGINLLISRTPRTGFIAWKDSGEVLRYRRRPRLQWLRQPSAP